MPRLVIGPHMVKRDGGWSYTILLFEDDEIIKDFKNWVEATNFCRKEFGSNFEMVNMMKEN